MRPFVLVAVAALAAIPVARGDDKAAMDGKWLIVYAEENSRRNTSWESKVATLKDGTLTYEQDGKQLSIKLTFGADQTVEGAFTGTDRKSGKGVCIVGRDYLCLSLNPAGGADKPDKKDDAAAGKSSGSFILILRRQREP